MGFGMTAEINNRTERNRKMNRFIGVGTLPRHAILNGNEKKVLRFTLATRYGTNKKIRKDFWAYVPCVIFRPSENTQKLLMENSKGLMLGLEGRVNTSKFESKGVTKYSTEVIVDERSVRILEAVVGSEPTQGKEQ